MAKRHSQMHVLAAGTGAARPFPLGHEAVQELLGSAWPPGPSLGGDKTRESPRVNMSGKLVVLSVFHPGGTHSSSEGLLLDLSARGAAVLYPGFLHASTECIVRIETTSGVPEWVDASVAGCSMLSKGIHRVSLQWLETLEIRKFVPASEWGKLGGRADVTMSQVASGRVLAVGINDIEVELVRVLLKDLPLEVDVVPFSGAAIDALHETAFDILVVNGDCTDLDAPGFMLKLREEGFDEPVLVLIDTHKLPRTSSESQKVRYLARPLIDEDFTATIREVLLDPAHTAGGSKSIVSSRADEPGVRNSIETFVRRVRELRATLRAASQSDNTDEARRCLRLLQNTGAGFGFQVLTDAASETLTQLNASGSAQEASPAIKRLIRILDRVRSPAGAQSADESQSA